jgi:HEPN domain-containing protein
VENVLFHCQQAAEKSLKGYLAWRNQPFRRTHDLEELVKQCADLADDFSVLTTAAGVLTQFGVDPRYPGFAAEATPEEMAQALRLADEIVSFVLERLPPEIHP